MGIIVPALAYISTSLRLRKLTKNPRLDTLDNPLGLQKQFDASLARPARCDLESKFTNK